MKTKIIATIGPKTDSEKMISGLIRAGVDMFRFNFSHATYGQFQRDASFIKKIRKETKKDVKIIQDLQGPRIRVGILPSGGVTLREGMEMGFSPDNTDLASNIIKIDDHDLHIDIKKGDPFFLSNGEIELVVQSVMNKVIWCRVTQGGLLSSNKAVNVPRTKLQKGGLTKKDIADVKFALKNDLADYIALSFVQTAEDVKRLRKVIAENAAGSKVKIISKIERGLAVDNINRIIVESDAIMIARGDLGIEVPIEDLPIIQKNLIRHAHWHNTPAIIATQVLTSMIVNPVPTRAEVSDISNAVFDHADAVMLSDETAIGAHPIEAVKLLKKVIKRTEDYLEHDNFFETEK